MLTKKPTDKHKTISEYVDMLYPDVSKAEKEEIAKTFYTQLSDGSIDEIRQKLTEEQ